MALRKFLEVSNYLRSNSYLFFRSLAESDITWFIFLTSLTNQEVVLHSIRLLSFCLKDHYIHLIRQQQLRDLCHFKIPFSRPIRKRQAKTPRLCLTHNQRYLLVHHEEDTEEEVFKTYILIVAFISSYITIIEEQAILAESTPLFLLHTTPQYHRGEEDNSRRAGAVYSASYC